MSARSAVLPSRLSFSPRSRGRAGGVEVDVEGQDLLARTLPDVEVVVEGQAGNFAEQVNGVLINVHML